MRKGSLVSSENEQEAGLVMSHHAYHTGSDNKDPDNNAQLIFGFASIIREALFCLFCCCCFQKAVRFVQVFRACTITFYGPVHIK